MTNSTDFGALNWVKDEIDQSIRKARLALESYVEGQAGTDSLVESADHLHQIAGVLRMAQVYGPGMLAEEMEAVVQGMVAGQVAQRDDAAEALMLALIQLPDYLELLQAGDADVPLLILPLLNELRAVREAPLLSEIALFQPRIDKSLITTKRTGGPNPELPGVVRRLRQIFHVALLTWFRKQETATAWQYLQEVFDELEQQAGTPQVYRLAWVCGALIRGLKDQSITPGVAIKQLFGKIDRQLKEIIDKGEDGFIDDQSDDLLKNLLYYIAHADSDNTHIQAVKQAFDLVSVLPSEVDLAQGRQGLSGSNAELAASIGDAIQSELTRVKDVLDLFMRKEHADTEMLTHLERPLRQLADTLGMIGQGSLRSRLLRQADKVKSFIVRSDPPEEYELMEMAGDILFVESSLGSMQNIQSAKLDETANDAKWGLSLPEGEYGRLIKQTVREARVDIAKAKEAIIGYTEAPDDISVLDGVYQGFVRVCGALKMLEFMDAATILEQTADFIKTDMVDAATATTRQQLNLLADIISSLEYFLEVLVDGAGNRQEIIAIAHTALDALLRSRPEPASEPGQAELIPFKPIQETGQETLESAQPDEGGSSLEQTMEEVSGLSVETAPLEEPVMADPAPVASRDKPALEDIDPEILEIFIEEAREELESIRQYLPAWQNNREDKNALTSFRRSFHTLKGSGRLVGAKSIGELAWAVENMLNRVIDETISPSAQMMDLLDQVVRILPELIEHQERGEAHAFDLDGLMGRAFDLAEGRAEVTPSLIDLSQLDIEEVPQSMDVPSLDMAETEDQPGRGMDFDAVDTKPADGEHPVEVAQQGSESLAGEAEGRQPEFSDSDITIEIDSELLRVFSEESENHLAVLEAFIAQTQSPAPSLTISEDIIRAYHTLHGSARMTGITPIANLSKAVENYLKVLNENNYLVDEGVISLLEDSVGYIRRFLAWLYDDELQEPNADSYLSRLAAAQDEALGVAVDSHTAVDGEEPTAVLPESSASLSEAAGAPSGFAEIDRPGLLEEPPEGDLYILQEDPELVDIFKEEAQALLQNIQRSYTDWRHEQADPEALGIIQRALHTLKGSARLAGITPIGDLSHAFEKVVIGLTESRLSAWDDLVEVVGRAIHTLTNQLDEVERVNKVHWATDLVEQLEALFEGVTEELDRKPDESGAELPDLDAVSIESGVTQQTTEPESVEPLDVDAAGPLSSAVAEYPADEVIENLELAQADSLFEVGEDPELLEVFIEEAKELLESLESVYAAWAEDALDNARLTHVQRILHTLKGSARLAGVLPVGDLSHALESVFIDLVEGRLAPDEDLKKMIRQVIDRLATQLEEIESHGKLHSADSQIEQLEALRVRSLTEAADSSSQPTAEESVEARHAEGETDEVFAAPLEPVSYLQADDMLPVGDDPELVEIFIEEAREIMEHLEAGYQQWSVDPADLSEIDGMQRSLHTLKGSSRLAGITPVGNLSHALESLLIKLVNRELEVSESVLRSSRQVLDKLANQLDEIATVGQVSSAESVLEQLEALMHPERNQDRQEPSLQPIEQTEHPESAAPPEVPIETAVVLPFVSDIANDAKTKRQEAAAQFKPSKDQVRINADLMDRLVNNAGEVSIYRARLEQQNNILGFNLTELEQTVSRLFTQLRNLEIETEAQILYRWDRDNEQDDRDKAEFDPLELDRFSTMQQLSRALVETVSDLGSIYEAMADLQRETDTLLLQQSRISTDLQDGLLRTRMVPFTQLVPRLQRLVRQTGEQLGKQAHLEVFGSEGELDRNILNRMIPVLEHLLRNAVSHGIEPPHDRRAAGKSESGRISLSIQREATDVLITLTDDGKGLDIEAIRTQAIRQGMIDADADVSDDDLIQCVLNPGFSTAKEVTQISGRGVGLDVVASEVKQLSGSLDIDSKPGQGTRFIIRLPLTLAITDALLVRVGEEIYAIPHGGVEAVVRIKQHELQACYQGQQHSYQYADRSYKTIYLGRMMGIENTELSENVKWFPLLLVHTGDHHVALQVDELLGTRQIVVKSVGKQIGSVRWITGGTILADGRVTLILDVGALVRMDAARVSTATPLTGLADQKAGEDRIRVMVVDDSITVRKVTGRLLERHDMQVVTAKDGVEAIALLQEQLPDIMLLDIEMPRMDGFEVARHINNSVDYYGLPIIMITSRVGEKHRQRAFQLGVKRCLGKPYQETELLENIHEVLAEVKV